MSETKRPRGRPPKPKLTPWLDSPPEYIRNWQYGENITDETAAYSRELGEQLRRDSVGEGVCEAYAQGRNTANKKRKNQKLLLLQNIYLNYTIFMDDETIYDVEVARRILKKPSKFSSIKEATLSKYIGAIRSNNFRKAKLKK